MKFSIVTVTYNSEKTLRETIESVRQQGYRDYEYIIVDGGSTDRTLEIIKESEDTVTRWISEPDRGISDAFNKGIRMATGEIIGIINSDDLLAPDALQIIADNIEQDTDVVYGNAISFGKDIDDYVEKPSGLQGLYHSMTIIHPATFVTKRAYEQYGVFEVELKCCMDRELLLRMYTKGAKFQYINHVLAKVRQGGINQKLYLKTTVSEGEAISIRYGMNKFKAKRVSAYKRIRYITRNAVMKTALGKKWKQSRDEKKLQIGSGKPEK